MRKYRPSRPYCPHIVRLEVVVLHHLDGLGGLDGICTRLIQRVRRDVDISWYGADRRLDFRRMFLRSRLESAEAMSYRYANFLREVGMIIATENLAGGL